MAEHAKPFDITDYPDLLRLAEEVRQSQEPRVLRAGNQDLAVVMPLSPRPTRRRKIKSPADYDAFRSAAGSWADVDTDRLVEEIYATRRRSNRPPLDL